MKDARLLCFVLMLAALPVQAGDLIFADRFLALLDGPDRPSGMVAEVAQGPALVVSESRRSQAQSAFEALDRRDLEAGFDPQALYGVFNEFALTHFGAANQPHAAAFDGELLDFRPEANWQHVSRNSASIAFGCNGPVIGYIEYGLSADALDQQSTPSERYFSLQPHHLSGLQSATTYYFRRVARAPSGETLYSHIESFTTDDGSDRIVLPAGAVSEPIALDQPGGHYLLDGDIIAEGTAVHIQASDITLDLNGYSIIHANEPIDDADGNNIDTAAAGVWARGSSLQNLSIVNGRIREGSVGNSARSGDSGIHSIYLSNVSNIDIAGLSIDYQGAQIHSLVLRYPDGPVRMHHNNFRDLGFEVLDRHGAGGGRPLRISDTSSNFASPNDYVLHHNLVKRSRHMGLTRANLMHHNELYIDSWATNSFAIQPHSRDDTPAGTLRDNRLYLTGYNPIGFGWAHLDLLVENNLVQMEGVRTADRRYSESWGEQDASSAFRITNYGSGGQRRDNLEYRGNLVVGRARGPGIMRGTMFFSDTSINNTLFIDNVVVIEAADDDANVIEATPVVAQGVNSARHDHQPTFYENNLLVSNVANVRFGDGYGRGSHHTLIAPYLERTGEHPDYHTIVFDGGFDTRGHRLIDPQLAGGAAVDDVWWRRTSNQSAYHIAWTLSLQGPANASVSIQNIDDDTVFTGQLDASGQLATAIDGVTIRPADWDPDDTFQVRDVYNHQKIQHSPHTVTVNGQSQQVTMDQPRSLSFP